MLRPQTVVWSALLAGTTQVPEIAWLGIMVGPTRMSGKIGSGCMLIVVAKTSVGCGMDTVTDYRVTADSNGLATITMLIALLTGWNVVRSAVR